ncbi:MAG TPA: nucleotidyltransferase family protein [Acidiferrobacterales bacterium]|nr:nucleotidyltransferase family protein [Acidiferrobacterales bacterium]
MSASVSAILLAAGESQRMNGRNKLLLSVGGAPLFRRSLETLLNSELGEIVVVLGYQQELLRPFISGGRIKICYNENYKDGHMSSIYTGWQALREPCDGVMICLADQPFLTSMDVNTLIAAFAGRGRHSIVVPSYQGQRGNPVVFAYQYRASVLQNNRNRGCRYLIDENPDQVIPLQMETDHVITDVDTLAAYEAVQRRFMVDSTLSAQVQ